MVLECCNREFLGTTLIFQKNNISWPQQPPKKKVLNFNMIFHDSTPQKSFSKHQNEDDIKNLDESEVLSSDFQTLELLQPHWPHRPLQPHWPLQPQKPYFTKKLPAPNDLFIPGTKMFNTGPFLWNGPSKIHIFTDIWYSFWLRLLRPADVMFSKNGCGTQKFPISAFQTHLQTQSNLHIFICLIANS